MFFLNFPLKSNARAFQVLVSKKGLPMSPFYTVDEVAALLRIAPATVRNRLCRGEDLPPSLRIGRRRLFPRDQFESWLDEQQTSQGIPEAEFPTVGHPTLGRPRERWNP